MGRGAGWSGGIGVGALTLALSVGGARAENHWVELAQIAASSTSSAATVFIDRDSIRWRGRHFEIWEMTRYQPLTRQTRLGPMVRNFPETRTLWAVRCPRRSIALVILGSDGVFHPREERLKFQVPAPGSAAAMIVEVLCDELKLRPPVEAVAEQAALADNPAGKRRLLELPPTMVDDDEE